jgi:hypothetical protein
VVSGGRVVGMKAAEEFGVVDEASPALVDRGGTMQGGRLRRETEEDLPQHIIVVRQGGRLRWRGDAAAAAAVATLAELSWGKTGPWPAQVFCQKKMLTHMYLMR